MNKISEIYSTFFYVGYSKYAPGTIGSIISIILIYILNNLLSHFYFITLFFILLIISLKLIDVFSSNIEKYDAKEIIIDEFLGIYLIFIFWEFYNNINHYINLLIILFLFRFFDIFKIYPANLVDKKMKNSLGVMLDDFIASIYTIIIIYIINAYY